MLRRFQEDLGRVFDETGLPIGGDIDASRVVTSQWSPAVDIKEEVDRYVIMADVPGVEPKAIDITMENGVLSIKGERANEARDEQRGYRRVERAHGTFHRRFSLPDSVDPEGITATGRNGVLEVTIPKQEKVQPRRIEVN
jgi:HSP20 family protein